MRSNPLAMGGCDPLNDVPPVSLLGVPDHVLLCIVLSRLPARDLLTLRATCTIYCKLIPIRCERPQWYPLPLMGRVSTFNLWKSQYLKQWGRVTGCMGGRRPWTCFELPSSSGHQINQPRDFQLSKRNLAADSCIEPQDREHVAFLLEPWLLACLIADQALNVSGSSCLPLLENPRNFEVVNDEDALGAISLKNREEEVFRPPLFMCQICRQIDVCHVNFGQIQEPKPLKPVTMDDAKSHELKWSLKRTIVRTLSAIRCLIGVLCLVLMHEVKLLVLSTLYSSGFEAARQRYLEGALSMALMFEVSVAELVATITHYTQVFRDVVARYFTTCYFNPVWVTPCEHCPEQVYHRRCLEAYLEGVPTESSPANVDATHIRHTIFQDENAITHWDQTGSLSRFLSRLGNYIFYVATNIPSAIHLPHPPPPSARWAPPCGPSPLSCPHCFTSYRTVLRLPESFLELVKVTWRYRLWLFKCILKISCPLVTILFVGLLSVENMHRIPRPELPSRCVGDPVSYCSSPKFEDYVIGDGVAHQVEALIPSEDCAGASTVGTLWASLGNISFPSLPMLLFIFVLHVMIWILFSDGLRAAIREWGPNVWCLYIGIYVFFTISTAFINVAYIDIPHPMEMAGENNTPPMGERGSMCKYGESRSFNGLTIMNAMERTPILAWPGLLLGLIHVTIQKSMLLRVIAAANAVLFSIASIAVIGIFWMSAFRILTVEDQSHQNSTDTSNLPLHTPSFPSHVPPQRANENQARRSNSASGGQRSCWRCALGVCLSGRS